MYIPMYVHISLKKIRCILEWNQNAKKKGEKKGQIDKDKSIMTESLMKQRENGPNQFLLMNVRM